MSAFRIELPTIVNIIPKKDPTIEKMMMSNLCTSGENNSRGNGVSWRRMANIENKAKERITRVAKAKDETSPPQH